LKDFFIGIFKGKLLRVRILKRNEIKNVEKNG